ncbi:hypothetical protein Bca101_048935 [Brassica carinata]
MPSFSGFRRRLPSPLHSTETVYIHLTATLTKKTDRKTDNPPEETKPMPSPELTRPTRRLTAQHAPPCSEKHVFVTGKLPERHDRQSLTPTPKEAVLKRLQPPKSLDLTGGAPDLRQRHATPSAENNERDMRETETQHRQDDEEVTEVRRPREKKRQPSEKFHN